MGVGAHVKSSHSLGTLIEWKLAFATRSVTDFTSPSSHSLGTLIEWKLFSKETVMETFYFFIVPTRWGH